MSERTQRYVSGRPPLSRDWILAAAMAIADDSGLGGLTMRSLARALGVEAMSLYHHIANRDEIVDGIVDLVLAEIELPGAGGSWKAALRSSAISAHDVLRRHPWACGPLMSAPRLLPSRLVMIESMLARLAEARLPAQLADVTYHALDAHILGSTMWEAGYAAGGPQLSGDVLEEFVRSIHIERYPHLSEHVRFHVNPRDANQPSEFEFVLDLILDAAEREGVSH